MKKYLREKLSFLQKLRVAAEFGCVNRSSYQKGYGGYYE